MLGYGQVNRMVAIAAAAVLSFCLKATIMPNTVAARSVASARARASSPALAQALAPAHASGGAPEDTPEPAGLHIKDNTPVRAAAINRVYAALDLGTNNCRLLVARPVRGGFQVIDAFSRIVRLGEGLAASGRLSDAAQHRAISALKVCADKVKRRRVHMMRHVATEACRRADNTQEFVARVFAETGLALDIVSPEEEARLAMLGCQALLPRSAAYGLVFDIGGGSTELILVRNRPRGMSEIVAWASVPWGVVSLADAYGDVALDSADYLEMKAMLTSHLAAFEERAGVHGRIRDGRLCMLGTSGTVTTLASLHLKLPFYDRRQVDGCWVPASSLRTLAQELFGFSVEERAALPCIGPERADLMLAGCAIIEAILDFWPVSQVRVADRGIREGILRVLMQRDGISL